MPQNIKNNRIVFFGTPDFSVPTLKMLINHQYQIISVVTQADKPVGRQQILSPSPIKKIAQQNNILVLQPKKLRQDQDFFKKFQELKPDLAIVVAYGQIIPQNILDVPKYGFINSHGSLLPKLRGASPMPAAILEGLAKTGITIMQMDATMDTGNILSQAELELPQNATISWLYDEMKFLSAKLLLETLPDYLAGKISPRKQDNSQASYCTLITKDMGRVDLNNDSPDLIYRKFRAYTPWPGVWTMKNNKRLKLIELDINNNQLEIKKVLPEGKKIMSWNEYLRGNS